MREQRTAILGNRVGIFLHRLNDAGDVRRAACAAEPLLTDRLDVELAFVAMAGFGHDLQRIHIEEAFAIERHAGQRGVVQGRFHDVRIFGFWLNLKHTARKERECDGRTAFRVGGVVRQIVVEGERLAHMRGTDAAGDIQFPVDDVAPERLAGFQQCCFPGDSRHVGHA